MDKFDYKKWIIEQKALRGAPLTDKQSNISKGPKGPKGPKNPTKFSPIDNPRGNSIPAPLALCSVNGISDADCHRWRICGETTDKVYLNDNNQTVVGPGTFGIDSSLPVGTIIQITHIAQNTTYYKNIKYMGNNIDSNVSTIGQTQYLGYLCDCNVTQVMAIPNLSVVVWIQQLLITIQTQHVLVFQIVVPIQILLMDVLTQMQIIMTLQQL
jgi:hypothetical protein